MNNLVDNFAKTPTETRVSKFIPWAWTLTPTDPSEHTCPSPRRILLTLGVVNIAVTSLALALGHRGLVSKITKGKLGKTNNTASWKYTWLVQLALVVIANLLNGYISLSAKYVDAARAPSLVDFILLFCLRPRFYAVPLNLLERFRAAKEGMGPWSTVTRASTITEYVLQLLGLWYAGMTAHHASKNEAYILGTLDDEKDATAIKMFTVAALLYVIYFSFVVAGHIALMFTKQPGVAMMKKTYLPLVVAAEGLICWVLCEMYWLGFVSVARDR